MRRRLTLSGRLSITLRLTLLFAAVSSSVLLLLGVVIGVLAERHFEELDLMLLNGKLELVEHALHNVDSAVTLTALLPERLDDALVGNHGLAVSVLNPARIPLYSTGNADFPATLLNSASLAPNTLSSWANADQQRFHGISAVLKTGINDIPFVTVAIATDTSHHDQFMHSFRLALWSVVTLAALLTGLFGWLAARRGLAPLQEIKQKATEITASSLDQRLSVNDIPVELTELADSLNAMLARLQASFHRLSDFSSDLAHELRTPLSSLLTQTQVTLSKDRSVLEYQDVLVSNIEEFERLSRTVADMLFLAKADHGLTVPHRETVALQDEASELLDFYAALAEEKALTLSLSGTASLGGDRLMLRRAISNLLANAIQHTPAGGSIKVKIFSVDNAVHLQVENSGETIAAEHLPRLFDRFYRVDASRKQATDGAGLGLAITQSIVQTHGGNSVVRSANGISCFELILPQ